MRHTGVISDWLLVSQVVGYTVSTVIVLLLAALVRRAARFDDACAYGLLVWSVLLWNAGNLVAGVGMLVGVPFEAPLVHTAMVVALSGAALSPAGALFMWHRLERPSAASIWLVRASFSMGVILTLWLWTQHALGSPLKDTLLGPLIGYHTSAFFVLGAWVFYRGRTTLASRMGIGMAGLGALGVGLSVLLEKGVSPIEAGTNTTLFEVTRQISTHLMTLGALLFLARFRFADVFIRQSLRMIAAVLLGVLCAVGLARPSIAATPFAATQGPAIALVLGTLAVAALLLSFTAVDRLVVAVVDRWLFQQPDYDRALARLRDALAGERDRAALHERTTRLVRDTMTLQDLRVASNVAVTKASPVVTVPVQTSDGAQDVLEATPRWDHPTLLDREIEFLRASATMLGKRLDAVCREQDEIDRLTREADLRRQVSEATLRALQAQVNPHFLFNTLNTIADLIQEDPAGAEAMTLRLAEVFSHVLTNGDRPFSSVHEEMEFLRTYLTIEEARFGDRLHVAFAVDPEAAHAIIPSLILQPAVENALKHGLSRKIGSGHLLISAIVDGGELQLSVEDDGVGPSTSLRTSPSTSLRASPSTSLRTSPSTLLRASPSTRAPAARSLRTGGVGLRNIAERLETLYADRASVRFGPAARGGSVVTVRLPLHAHDQEPVG